MPLLHPSGYCAMLIFRVVCGHHSGFPPLKVCVASFATMKARLRNGVFRSVPAQGFLGPVSEGRGIFSTRDLPSGWFSVLHVKFRKCC